MSRLLRRLGTALAAAPSALRGGLFPVPHESVPEGDLRLFRALGWAALLGAICVGVGVVVLILAAAGVVDG